MFKLVPPAALLLLVLTAPVQGMGHKCMTVVGVPVAPSYSAPATYAVAAPVTYAAAPVAYVAPQPTMQMVPVSLAPVQMVAPQAAYTLAPQVAYAPPQGYRLVPQQQTGPQGCDRDGFERRDNFERIGPPRGAAGAGPSTSELSDRLDRLTRAVEELAVVVRRHSEQLKPK